MSDYDIYIIMDQTLNFKETLEKYILFLNDKKMLIISYQNLKDIINEKEYLKNNNIKYETINFDNKNVILLAKENLKSKFNEDRKSFVNFEINYEKLNFFKKVSDVSLLIRQSKENFFNEDTFKQRTKDNIWVKKYYEVIDKFKLNGKIVDGFNRIKIEKYYKNFRNEIGQWNYQRHHINEIKISGAILKSDFNENYKKDLAILVTFDEHLFLHYLIVMAKTTSPNDGMLVPLNLWFKDENKSIEYWDKKIQEMCIKYNVDYIRDWPSRLDTLDNILK